MPVLQTASHFAIVEMFGEQCSRQLKVTVFVEGAIILGIFL
jgi:hypothetical protein